MCLKWVFVHCEHHTKMHILITRNFGSFLPSRPNWIHTTHKHNHTICMWRLMSYEHMYTQTYRQLLLLFRGRQLALSRSFTFTAHIKKRTHTNAQQTKCPFQQQRRRSDGVRPRPPKSQTKVHPCCRGQNLPFCQLSGPMPRSRPILELNNRRTNTRDVCQPQWRVGWRALTFHKASDQRLVAAIVGLVFDCDATIEQL